MSAQRDLLPPWRARLRDAAPLFNIDEVDEAQAELPLGGSAISPSASLGDSQPEERRRAATWVLGFDSAPIAEVIDPSVRRRPGAARRDRRKVRRYKFST